MKEKITGATLIGWGCAPGAWFAGAIEAANRAAAEGRSEAEIRALVAGRAPPPILPPQAGAPVAMLIEAGDTPDETDNLAKVRETMAELMKTPTLEAGAVMPDACPAGGLGTIPVGGIASARGAIHPGMHSADICCSVAITVIGDVDPAKVLDAGQRTTHFGPGGRGRGRQIHPPDAVKARFAENAYLRDLGSMAIEHFATQGDGNHFFYVGRLASSGEVAIVTHHGSRKPGAMLYKRGMVTAERHRRRLSPETRKQNAWIPFDSDEGRTYWDALLAMRDWTKANHFAVHDLTLAALGLKPRERFWNEHNFVFRRGDMFLHGKGATPAWKDFAPDSNGLTLIPLNMAAPILIARGSDNAEALGFCPHGAGRNFSRSEHARRNVHWPAEEQAKAETEGLDARFFCGIPDATELPSAYKRADQVEAQIARFGLAEIVDRVEPYGCIMVGDWMRPAREGRAARKKHKSRGRT